jgi:hypothetical protein
MATAMEKAGEDGWVRDLAEKNELGFKWPLQTKRREPHLAAQTRERFWSNLEFVLPLNIFLVAVAGEVVMKIKGNITGFEGACESPGDSVRRYALRRYAVKRYFEALMRNILDGG